MVEIREVKSKSELKKFIKFKLNLYKGDPYNVPSLTADDMQTLTKGKNPALDFCDFQCFLAYREGQIAGRICALINPNANKQWNHRHGRFGFFDCIEDLEVARELLDASCNWLRERGMDTIEGPMGFTDMDYEGMLTEGFNQMSTMVTLYNYPYYPKFMEQLGYAAIVNWVEYKVYTPQKIDSRIPIVAQITARRYNLHKVQLKSTSQMISHGWIQKLFTLYNQAYAPLYGFTTLNQSQIDYYIKQYVPLLKADLVSLIADKDDNLVAFGITIPSLAKALRKANGRLFPFGFFHLLRALKSKRSEVCDLLIIAVDPSYHGRGVNAMIMVDTVEILNRMGTKYCESNPELEENIKMQGQWGDYQKELHKRRSIFARPL